MKVTYCAVVDTQKKVVRVYGRKMNATYDHATYKIKQRARFLEGFTSNQMEQRVSPLTRQGFKVCYMACAKGGFDNGKG